jgi:hypothetical protein
MKTYRIASLAIVGLFAIQEPSYAGGMAFTATTDNLLGSSISREPVDIEIVGSTSLVPREHTLEPDRVLRFRLERAYINEFLTKSAPGFSLLSVGVDRPTGLAEGLISAASLQGSFRRDLEGVPVLDLEEAIRRQVILSVRSDHSEGSRSGYLKSANECVGAFIGNDLFEMNQTPSLGARACSHSAYPDGRKWLARNDGGTNSVIECHGDGKRIIGCTTEFVFQQFSVGISFHQSFLAEWRSVLAFGEAFLRSKQVAR